MTDTPKKNREEVPPDVEAIVSKFESLSITPTSSPPFVVSEQPLDTEQDLKDQEKKSNMTYRVGREGGASRRRGRPVANAEVIEVMQ